MHSNRSILCPDDIFGNDKESCGLLRPAGVPGTADVTPAILRRCCSNLYSERSAVRSHSQAGGADGKRTTAKTATDRDDPGETGERCVAEPPTPRSDSSMVPYGYIIW
jgi:hypothetical protein